MSKANGCQTRHLRLVIDNLELSSRLREKISNVREPGRWCLVEWFFKKLLLKDVQVVLKRWSILSVWVGF